MHENASFATPSLGLAPRCSSLSSSPLPSVPWIPHPQLVPLGAGVGRRGRRVHRAQVSGSGGLLGDMLEAGWWRAGVNPQGDGYTGLGI